MGDVQEQRPSRGMNVSNTGMMKRNFLFFFVIFLCISIKSCTFAAETSMVSPTKPVVVHIVKTKHHILFIMKKSFLYVAMCLLATLFVGCKDHLTPETDNTKLWPAANASGEYLGYIDAKGNFAIQPIYVRVSNFSCGYALVWLSNSDKPSFVDTKGKMQVATFDEADAFYYKYARVVLGDRFGLMNTKFDFAVQPMYYRLDNMSKNGLAAAQLTSDSKWGFVNSKGDQKIQPIYDEVYPFDEGAAIVRVGSKYGAINTSGDYVLQPSYDDLAPLGNGLIAYEQNNRIGAFDARGNAAVPPIYYDMDQCVDNNLIPAQQTEDSKWCYITTKGDVKLSALYDFATPFYEGYAEVKVGDKYYVIDTNGKYVITLGEKESLVSLFHNGLALMRVSNDNSTTYKYIDTKGNTIYSWTIESSSWYDKPAKKPGKEDAASLIEMTRHFDSSKL